MKAKIKKTGEIVELNEQGLSLFEYARGIYKDVNGNKYKVNEFEFIEEKPEKDIDWEQRRFMVAKDVLITFMERINYNPLMQCNSRGINPYKGIVQISVQAADTLIDELKKGGEK